MKLLFENWRKFVNEELLLEGPEDPPEQLPTPQRPPDIDPASDHAGVWRRDSDGNLQRVLDAGGPMDRSPRGAERALGPPGRPAQGSISTPRPGLPAPELLDPPRSGRTPGTAGQAKRPLNIDPSDHAGVWRRDSDGNFQRVPDTPRASSAPNPDHVRTMGRGRDVATRREAQGAKAVEAVESAVPRQPGRWKRFIQRIPGVGRFVSLAALAAAPAAVLLQADQAYASEGLTGALKVYARAGVDMTPILGDVTGLVDLAGSFLSPQPGEYRSRIRQERGIEAQRQERERVDRQGHRSAPGLETAEFPDPRTLARRLHAPETPAQQQQWSDEEVDAIVDYFSGLEGN
jgi:hypothetical protein